MPLAVLDDEVNRQVRQKAMDCAAKGPGGVNYATPGPDGLRDSVLKLRADNHIDYRLLPTEPNFLEDLAILVARGGIDFEIVNLSVGYLVAYRWSLWKPTIDARRELAHEPLIYNEFEKLAKRFAAENPHSLHVNV